MKLEQQLKGLHDSFEQALSAQDWDVLAQLDNKLQRAIPKIKQQRLTEAEKLQLQKLNSLYSTMIAAGEREKAETQQQITQQASNREGMLAYMQNR
ncbi:hypothetical protein C942_03687 [Photobacterium marinum]|uniref:Flagellar protein FliT n=1 Tax=Photobacterium marinum TaxID=1056511 RepID=L8JE03_9GAMM|nr:hypothetical protein [Photobacterium marinum]ELR67086.1 hypothetical protein C942_03687 [Photobacterium marinum]